jgi:tRNA-binding EMAP/Myf-like protein
MLITYDDFEKVNIRSGTVVKAEPFPWVQKPVFKVWVDFGTELRVVANLDPSNDPLYTGKLNQSASLRRR